MCYSLDLKLFAMQAGSDSLLTSAAFIKLASSFFGGLMGVSKYKDVLYGYGKTVSMFVSARVSMYFCLTLGCVIAGVDGQTDVIVNHD